MSSPSEPAFPVRRTRRDWLVDAAVFAACGYLGLVILGLTHVVTVPVDALLIEGAVSWTDVARTLAMLLVANAHAAVGELQEVLRLLRAENDAAEPASLLPPIDGTAEPPNTPQRTAPSP